MPVPFKPARNLWVAVLLFILCLLLFASTLDHSFMMDDKALIVRNPALFDPGFLQIDPLIPSPGHLTGGEFVYFRPVAQIFIALPAYFFGKDPFIYRVLSVILFYLACLSVYELVFSLFRDVRLALLTSVFFCLHPMNGVLANYITASGYSVLVMAVNMAVVSFLAGCDKKQAIYFLGSAVLFLFALLCHEIAIAFPLYLGAALYFARKEKPATVIKWVALFSLLLGMYYLFRQYYAVYSVDLGGRLAFLGLNATEFLSAFSRCVFWYAKGLVFLNDIILMWTPTGAHRNAMAWSVALVAGAAGSLYFIFARRQSRYAFGLSWILIGLIPVFLAAVSRPSFGVIIEPHWLFFPTIGFCLVISMLLGRVYDCGRRVLALALLGGLGLAYFSSTLLYNSLWENEKRYCHYMEGIAPTALLNSWLADASMEEGDFLKAREYYRRALKGHKADWQAYTNLGLIENVLGNKEGARNLYFKALRLNPQASSLKNNLAELYLQDGRMEQAEKLLLEVVRSDYYDINARKNLIVIYARKGLKTEAEAMLVEAVRIDAHDPDIDRLRQQINAIP